MDEYGNLVANDNTTTIVLSVVTGATLQLSYAVAVDGVVTFSHAQFYGPMDKYDGGVMV